MLRGDGEGKRFGVREADVFAGKNDDTARDEAKVFAGMQHFREPIDRAFLIGRTHALDEGADRVVVRVAGAIVDDGLLLDALLGHFDGEMDDRFAWRDALRRVPVFRFGRHGGRRSRERDRRSGEHADFEGVQTFSRVAIADLREMLLRVVVHLDAMLSETALGIGEGAVDQLLELFDAEWFELEDLRAGDERSVDVEKRIVSGRADQA